MCFDRLYSLPRHNRPVVRDTLKSESSRERPEPRPPGTPTLRPLHCVPAPLRLAELIAFPMKNVAVCCCWAMTRLLKGLSGNLSHRGRFELRARRASSVIHLIYGVTQESRRVKKKMTSSTRQFIRTARHPHAGNLNSKP